MALPSITSVATLSFFLFISIAICLEAKELKLKKTEMMFYMHDWEIATKEENVTNIPVAGNRHKKWYITEFGTVFVLDDALTLGYERNSTEIGRAHGVYVNSALDGSNLHFFMSLVFTDKKYNGRTLEIRGADRWFLPSREVAVVSGTGKFRLARGYTSLETVFLDIPNLNAILRWNLTVFHYYS